MNIDPACLAFATAWLKGTGHNNTVDIARLTERIQDCIEDFYADLANADRDTREAVEEAEEKARHHGL